MTALLACFLVAAGPDLSVTTNDLVEAHANNKNGKADDDDYGALITRTTVGALWEEYEAQVRIDSATFVNRPTLAYKNDLRPERVTAVAHWDPLEVTLGDAYRQLGRGLLLSLRKEDAIGLDVTLRGGAVEYLGDSTDALLFAGFTNPSNLDAVSEKYLPDANDPMAGAAYRLHFDGGSLGAMALAMRPRERLIEEAVDHTEAGGAFVDWPSLASWLAVYAEVDAQHRVLAGTSKLGYAAYGTADLTFGDTALLLESIYLNDFEMRGSTDQATGTRFTYNRPPTLQRLEEQVIDSPSALGARARLTEKLEPVTLFLNVLYRVDKRDDPNPITTRHAWGGGELSYADGAGRVNLVGGFRREEDPERVVMRLIHLDADWIQPVTNGAAIHLATTNELRRQPGLRYFRGSSFAGIDWRPIGTTFELGYDTQNPTVRNVFYAGIITARLGDDWKIDATVGTQRGGIKCVAGVCREFPAFAGAKLEVAGRF